MTKPEDSAKSAADRFRSIMSEDRDDKAPPEKRMPAVVNLPPVSAPGGSGRRPERQDATPAEREPSGWRRGLAAFWTVACVVSLVINVLVLLLVLPVLRGLQTSSAVAADGNLLLGMYTGLAKMDDAHINTALPIQTVIPLNLTVPIHTTSGITLAQDATIEGAHVRISTALFNIDAPASVTLPAGTKLDVALDLQLPIETKVPVDVTVPIDVAIRDTDLHGGISSMQDALRPLICSTSPGARTAAGEPICQ